MPAGFALLHRLLAELLLLVALINLALVMSRARTDARAAAWVDGLVRYGVGWAGRGMVAIGMALRWGAPEQPWAWWALCLSVWAGVELLGRRWVLPDTGMMALGGQGTSRMLVGATGQLIGVAILYGLMAPPS